MGFWAWYHERRIRELHDQHPKIDVGIIRGDYMARVRGYGGMGFFNAFPPDDGRTFEYDLALINAVDESFPKRVNRFVWTAIDTLFD